MNTKNSLLNKTIIKTDFRRFWYITAIYLVLLLVFVYSSILGESTVYDGNYIESIKYYITSDEGLLAIFMSAFTGALLFSYLHKSNSVSAMHGIPVSRTAQFLSHYLVGAILIAIPIIITTIVIIIVSITHNISLKYAAQYFYASANYAFLFFSISAFSAIIAGNLVTAYVFTLGFTILPAFLYGMIEYLFDTNLYGYAYTTDYLIEKIYIAGLENMWDKSSLWYILIAIVLFFVSLILYKIRKLEYFDEIVVFKALRYVFVITVTACFSLFSYYLFDNIASIRSFACFIPLGLVALLGTSMLNNKSASLKGMLKPTIIYLVSVLFVFCIFNFDITGFEKRVPSPDDVESICIEEPNYNIHYDYDNLDYDIREFMPKYFIT
ncbi:MAG: hypothetical protein ACI4VF_08240, partial [Lachnospirales bacterium]